MSGNRLLLACAALLIGAAAMKDIVFIGGGFYLREISQGICLMLGLYFLPIAAPKAGARVMLPVLGYLLALAMGATDSSNWDFVALQVLSLAAVLLFALALWNGDPANAERNHAFLFRIVFYILLGIGAASLLAAVAAPGAAYETIYGGEIRFRGVLSKAGWMGASAGMLAGLALFGRARPGWLRGIGFVIGVACLLLAGARTFWIAFAIASIACCFLYFPREWRRFRWVGAAAALFVVLPLWVGMTIDTGRLESMVRFGSVSTFSGRTTLWEEALDAFGMRPWLGFGLSQGAAALTGGEADQSLFASQRSDPRAISRITVHSGYLQSMLDAGILGTVFYALLLLGALLRITWSDRARAYPAAFFFILFMMIGNVSENVIYAASTFPSMLFWVLCIFALSAPMMRPAPALAAARADAAPPPAPAPAPRHRPKPLHARIAEARSAFSRR